MANPREYTCRLLEMVDSGILSADDVMNASVRYMSDSDVEDMMYMNQWDDTIDEESTEEDEIIIGSTVTIDGVEYVAETGNDSCQGCVGAGLRDRNLCHTLPDCGDFIFVRKENQ